MEYYSRVTQTSHYVDFTSANPSIEFLRHVWVDFSGIVRMRILTTSHCLKLYTGSRRYGCGPALMLSNVTGSSEKQLPPLKQQKFDLIPDWSSLRICEFSPAHAWVMCFVRAAEEKDPFFQCPRFLLAKVLEIAEKSLEPGTGLLAGFEIEFSLLTADFQPLQDIDVPYGWCSVSGLRGRKLDLMEEVVRTLQRSGIGVSHFHVESFRQLEFATDPYPPMQAVDNYVYTAELLRHVAVRHDYRATLSIKPTIEPVTGAQPFSVVHVHFSISKEKSADSFLAGILRRLSDIVPFAMPTYDSYFNFDLDDEGMRVCWGTENRDVAIRGIEKNHWEFRLSDATANFHLLVAILLRAGIDGVQNREPLTWKDLRHDLPFYTEAELVDMGVTQRLPQRLKGSLQTLHDSEYLTQLLGAEMKRLYHMVKQRDEEAFSRMSEEDRRLQYIRFF